MIRHPVHKAAARERPGACPARASRPARHSRVTPVRRRTGWLRPVGDGRPERDATSAVLRDGSRVLVRQVRSTDTGLLAEGFARLSERSRRMRFLGKKDELTAAEIALTITDDWQGRGLGTELLARLSHRGRQEGICHFTGVVSHDNVPMGMLMRSVGAVETNRSFGTVEYEIALMRAGEYSLDCGSAASTTAASSAGGDLDRRYASRGWRTK